MPLTIKISLSRFRIFFYFWFKLYPNIKRRKKNLLLAKKKSLKAKAFPLPTHIHTKSLTNRYIHKSWNHFFNFKRNLIQLNDWFVYECLLYLGKQHSFGSNEEFKKKKFRKATELIFNSTLRKKTATLNYHKNTVTNPAEFFNKYS